MRKRILLLGFFFVINPLSISEFSLSKIFAESKNNPQNNSISIPFQVVNGILDLREAEFYGKSIYALDGEWLFKIKSEADDEIKSYEPSVQKIIQVPGSWNATFAKSGFQTGLGRGTYFIRILLPENRPNYLALKVGDTSTAFRLYSNQELIHENGRVGHNRNEMVPSYKHPLIFLNIDNSHNHLDLRLDVSNFYHSTGGIRKSIYIGGLDGILQNENWGLARDWSMFSAIFFIGFFYMIVYIYFRKDKSTLIFSIFCFIMSTRSLFTGSVIAYENTPDTYWVLIHKLDLLSFVSSIPLFVYFLQSLFPDEFYRSVFNLNFLIASIFFLIVIILPSHVYMEFIPIYQLFVGLNIPFVIFLVYKTIKRNREGAFFLLFGTMAVTFTTANDMLNQALVINTGYYSSFGLIAFFLSKASLLTFRHANTILELTRLKSNLEKTVALRTEELHQEKTFAEEANVTKERLLELVSRELKKPMSQVSNLLDSVLEDYDQRNEKEIMKILKESRAISKESLTLIEYLHENRFYDPFQKNKSHGTYESKEN